MSDHDTIELAPAGPTITYTYYCPGVLGGDTGNGGNIFFYYCPGVLGGDTGYTQEEGIDYDEVFAPVARIEAIRLFFAYASFKDFVVYQMDVKSDFHYGKIEEEVYVCQPPSFEDPDFPDRAYKVKTASTPMENSTPLLRMRCEEVDVHMEGCLDWNGKAAKDEFGLQALVDGKKIIITEATIRRDDLQLDDAEGTNFLPNATIFEQLTLMGAKPTAWNEFSSIMASAIICLATNQRFNISKFIFDNMVKNLDNVNKFWMYPRFVQVFMNQHVGDMSHHKRIYVTPSHTKKIFANMKRERKGFSGRITPLFPIMMVQAQEEMGEGSANPIDPLSPTLFITQPSTSQPQKKQKRRKPKRKDSEIPQSSGPTEPIADEAANEENVPTHSNVYCLVALEIESLKKRVKKLEKKKRSRTYKLKRLYKVGLSAKVVSSDDEASLGDQEDASKQGRKILDIDTDEDITLDSTHFDTNPDIFGVHDINGDEVFIEIEEPVVNLLHYKYRFQLLLAKYLSNVDITLAQALAELKNTRPKAKGLVMQEKEPMASTPITSSKDKGKGIMVEEPLKMKKKDQVLFDKQEAIRLQAQFDKEDTIAREKEEVNAALIGQWNDIQDKVETDYELAKRLQAEEQEELTIEEKAKLFQQLLEKRRKYFAVKREEEKRNRPPTKAQQRSLMSTYLKNMARWKPRDLKNKTFTNIQELFDKAMKRVNTFVDMDIELVEGSEVRAEGNEIIAQERSLKRAGDELEQEKGRIIGIKRLHDDLEVTAAKLVLLVQKLLLLVLKINTAERLQLLEEFMLTEKG
ncbi:putative ribonuclease H-like domain-containing protein [Tanacetum coccineum]